MFHYFFFKFNIFLNIFYFKKDKRKGNQKSIEESSCSSTPTDIKDNESTSFNDCENSEFFDNSKDYNENNKRIIINKIKYYSKVSRSVFNIRDFKLTKENFLQWYEPLKRHLTTNDFDTFIDKKLNIHDMNRIQIKSDNAVQSVIINSLDESTQEYLCGW